MSVKIQKNSIFASMLGLCIFASGVILLWGLNYYFAPIYFNGYEEAGQAGDMFGGLTALFSGLAFAGLLITLFMQRRELELQREQLVIQSDELAQTREVFSIQKFENTFFGMLELLNRQVQSISYTNNETLEQFNAKDALERMASKLEEDYRYFYRSNNNNIKTIYNTIVNPNYQLQNYHYQYDTFVEERFLTLQEIADEYKEKYDKVFETDLGPYFRIIYNILKLIEKVQIQVSNPQEVRQGYADLLRAHLCSTEVKLLMFNCIAPYGEKMKPYTEKYGLLKHLTEKDKQKHKVIVGAYNKTAFSN